MRIEKSTSWSRVARAALLALLLAEGLASAAAAAAPPPIEDFVRAPDISGLVLSPSGKSLAVTLVTDSGRQQLAVMTLDPRSKLKALAGFADADVTAVHWVNEERLVYSAADWTVPGDTPQSSGLFAINRDGSDKRQLVAFSGQAFTTGSHITSRMLPYQFGFYRTLDDGSNDVVLREWRFDKRDGYKGITLSRLDTTTGEKRSLTDRAPEGGRYWLLDGKGVARVVQTENGGRSAIHWRAGEDQPWLPIAEFGSFGSEGMAPWLIDGQDQLYVRTAKGRDTQAIYRFDPVKKALEAEPLIGAKGFDIEGPAEFDDRTGQLLGAHLGLEGPVTHWFDKDLRAVQQQVDSSLPGDRFNTLICGRCQSSRFIGVRSTSDRVSADYYVYDRQEKSLLGLGSARPWLPVASQGRRSYQAVAARDGLMLPVYLTTPPGTPKGTPLPAVVLVHDGPWVRGHDLAWDRDAQFLATRGYLVIQVDYRGSSGYGIRHFEAGWKQWGLRMEDDLTDAVAWATRQGLVDAGRVCIVGGSYGGYAALMGAVREPSLYKCVVSYAGVTDIDLVYSQVWSNLSDAYKEIGMPLLIGDRKADAEQLAQTSPLKQVARIKVPVLLAHGGDDRRVPIEHARAFRKAAEAAGVKVESVEYLDEAHGWRQPKNDIDFWKRVEAFLAKSLAPSAAP